MQNLIYRYIKIIMSLVLFAVVLTFISYMSGVSRKLLYKIDNDRAYRESLHRSLDYYDYNNIVISRDDVMSIVARYSLSTTIQIQTQVGGSWIILTPTSGESSWNIDNLRETLDNIDDCNYLSTILLDSSNNPCGFRFTSN